MSEVTISDGDIVSLGNKLDGLGLPNEQKMLLSAIVSLGSESLAASAPTMSSAELAASFRDQFEDSFNAGEQSGNGGVTLKIGR